MAYDLAYDLSPVEFVVFRVAIYWVLMVFAFAMGRRVGQRISRTSKDHRC